MEQYGERLNLEDISEILSADSIPLKKRRENEYILKYSSLQSI